jgi:Tol biopolymer transport system component
MSFQRTAAVCAVCTTVFVNLLVEVSPAGAAFPGPNGKILFDTNRDGPFEIYVMNPDGTALTNISNHPANDQFAAWSPCGTKVAFSSDRDGPGTSIYVANADGTGVERLTSFVGQIDFDPAWSPDGTKIVFESNRDDGNRDVFVMNVDGSNQIRLTSSSAFDGRSSWSPNGAHIAFRSSRDGNGEIYVMGSDGAGQTNLTNNTAEDNFPNWSPDGSRIAFSSLRDGNSEVYVMNSDGTGQTRLTFSAGDDGAPAWSSDGLQIAFASNRDGNFEVYVMNADGAGQMNVTQNPVFDTLPDWGPKGALEQVSDVIAIVQSLGLSQGTETSLIVKLQQAAEAVTAGDPTAARNRIDAFIQEARAQSGKAILPDSNQLISAANQIRAAIGCT